MRIAIIVDNPSRDLPGAVLLAMALARRGVTAILVPLNLRRSEFAGLRVDLVLLTSLYKILDDFVRFLDRKGHQLAVLDNEGAIWCDFEEYEQALTADPEIRRKVTRMLCWGPLLARHFVGSGLFRSDQVVVTGHPRMDFYAPTWRSAFAGRPEFAGRPVAPYIVVATKAPLANPRFQTVEKEIDTLVANGCSREAALAWLELDRANFEAMMALTDELARRLPDTRFLVRPHPFERAETYEHRLGHHANVSVHGAGTIDGWLIGASALVQRSSSTAVEAGLLGIPSISPDWLPPLDPQEWPLRVSFNCRDIDELEDHVRRAVASRLDLSDTIRADLEQVCDTWVGHVDGIAYQRVADHLVAVADTARASADGNRSDPQPLGEQSLEATVPPRRHSLAERLRHVASDPTLVPGIVLRKLTGGRLGRSFVGRAAKDTDPGLEWDRSPKAFGAEDVRTLVRSFGPTMDRTGPPAIPLRIRAADGSVDYSVRNKTPRSIVIEPED